LNGFYRMLAKASGLESVQAGDEVTLRLDLILGHDGSADAVLAAWPPDARVAQPERVVLTADHGMPAPTVAVRELHLAMQRFAQEHRIHFFQHGEGVLHQVVAERFTPQPGWIIAGADGHVSTAGAFGSIAFTVSADQLVSCMREGSIRLRAPECVVVEFSGATGDGVSGRDLGLALVAQSAQGKFKGKALLLQGNALDALPLSDRMAICNMIGETGATTGLIMPAGERSESADIVIDAGTTGLLIACPSSPSNVVSLKNAAGLSLTQVVVGGCSSGRIEDMQQLVRGLGSRRVHDDVTLLVTPASDAVAAAMDEQGIAAVLRKAGAIQLPPGCGPCPGKHLGLASRHDRVLAASVRNTAGRMGSAEAEIYLASALVAGASAAAGEIAAPA
jgi:homoaconitase/3-isopropylmalate dehydratase large subunit